MTSDQQQLGDANALPTRIEPERADWEALGFHFGKQNETDPIFTHTLLPMGWTQEDGSGLVWKVLRDEQQRARAHAFYEPAPHLRDAHMRLLSVAEYVQWALQHDEPVVADEAWAPRQALVEVAQEATRRLLEEMRTLSTGLDSVKAMVAAMDDFQRYNALAILLRQRRFLQCPAKDCEHEEQVSEEDEDASMRAMYDHFFHQHANYSRSATRSWMFEVKEVMR